MQAWGRRYLRAGTTALVAVSVLAVSIAPAEAGRRGHGRRDAPQVVIVDPGPAAGGAGVPTWSAEFMTDKSGSPSFDPGLTNALRQADNFDVIAAHQWTYDNYVAQMKAENPSLKLFVYLNGTFSGSQSPTQYPDSWYARDVHGNKIQAIGFNTYLLDLRNPSWRAEVLNLCRTRLATSGYDGCFVDVLGTSGINPASVTGLPIDPRTGDVWTRRDWLDATTAIAAGVSAGVAPAPVFGNGLVFGGAYFYPGAPSSRILDGLAGGMSEAFVRPAKSGVNVYRNEAGWKQDVDMLVDAGSRGEFVSAITKVWTTSTAAQQDAWHRYAMATFLLGYQPGGGFFTFRVDKTLTPPSPYWNVPLGDPTGSYAKVGGVYQRWFTNGRVLVNPTTSPVTVALGGSYVDLDGSTVTSVTMRPHTGQVLTLG